MQAMISKAYEVADEEDGEGGKGTGGGKAGNALVSGWLCGGLLRVLKVRDEIRSCTCCSSFRQDVWMRQIMQRKTRVSCGGCTQGVSGTAEPLDEASLTALPEEVLEPAGSVQSVMDDVVVVQGLANSRALTEG